MEKALVNMATSGQHGSGYRLRRQREKQQQQDARRRPGGHVAEVVVADAHFPGVRSHPLLPTPGGLDYWGVCVSVVSHRPTEECVVHHPIVDIEPAVLDAVGALGRALEDGTSCVPAVGL